MSNERTLKGEKASLHFRETAKKKAKDPVEGIFAGVMGSFVLMSRDESVTLYPVDIIDTIQVFPSPKADAPPVPDNVLPLKQATSIDILTAVGRKMGIAITPGENRTIALSRRHKLYESVVRSFGYNPIPPYSQKPVPAAPKGAATQSTGQTTATGHTTTTGNTTAQATGKTAARGQTTPVVIKTPEVGGKAANAAVTDGSAPVQPPKGKKRAGTAEPPKIVPDGVINRFEKQKRAKPAAAQQPVVPGEAEAAANA